MTEQKHEIKLPDGDWKLSVTKQEAENIRDQCDKILAEKPQRQSRCGDVVQKCNDHCSVRTGYGHWNSLSCDITWTDAEMNSLSPRLLFNLHDLLNEGPIVVGLREEEVKHYGSTIGTWWAIKNKVEAALARYRENQKKERGDLCLAQVAR